jgi:hypothetical protein
VVLLLRELVDLPLADHQEGDDRERKDCDDDHLSGVHASPGVKGLDSTSTPIIGGTTPPVHGVITPFESSRRA